MSKGHPVRRAAQALAHPAIAIQGGMNLARKLVWKHMSAADKAKYLLRQAFQAVGGK